jgi:hypothetical protein
MMGPTRAESGSGRIPPGFHLEFSRVRATVGTSRPRKTSVNSRSCPVVLERRYPGVVESLYQNLVRAEGKDATTIVAVFIERLDEMEKGEAPYGAEGPRVREYLRGRGLPSDQ